MIRDEVHGWVPLRGKESSSAAVGGIEGRQETEPADLYRAPLRAFVYVVYALDACVCADLCILAENLSLFEEIYRRFHCAKCMDKVVGSFLLSFLLSPLSFLINIIICFNAGGSKSACPARLGTSE